MALRIITWARPLYAGRLIKTLRLNHMADNTITKTEYYHQFEEWINKQPYWLQDAAWRIYHGEEIGEEQIACYVDMCISQVNKKSVSQKNFSSHEIEASPENITMSVLCLNDISGVNALAMDAHLDFHKDGVNVVYGLNGAGKSGYMRIFKCLSRTPYEEPIQPNIFSNTTTDRKSCKFTLSENGETKEIFCNLSSENKDTILQYCDVFDARISSKYISKQNTVSYQPFVFTVLTELSKIADRISNRIDSLGQSISERKIEIPTGFQDCEETQWINKLEAGSIIPERFLFWNDTHETELKKLQGALNIEKIESELELLRSQRKTLKPVLDDMNAALSGIEIDEIERKYKKLEEAKKELSLAQKLFSDSADDFDKISIEIEDWKQLWSIAKRYYENSIYKTNGNHFGENGSICPLCHQTITGSAHTRFKNVNDYINGTCNDNYNKAEQAIGQLINHIASRTYSKSQISNLLSDIICDENVKKIESVYDKFAELKSTSKIEDSFLVMQALEISNEINILAAANEQMDNKIQNLQTSLQSDEQAAKKKRLKSLQCHKWIYENLAQIKEVIANLVKLKTYENAKCLATTNKITTESNTLANALITDAYINRFKQELRLLAPEIKVKLEKTSSKKGTSPYKITLNSINGNKYKPEDILSEGEQRIVALAEFFAEATGRTQKTPIIIDDPISSLDYNFEDAATKRIVELAKTRQVIIFTHRISLVVGIETQCEQMGVPLHQNFIRSGYHGKGIPDLEDVYHGNIKKNLNSLIQKIAETKKKDPDSSEYSDAVEKICKQFRICVERTVEDELLFGMVKRFRRSIQTLNKTAKLALIDSNDCKMIDDMMTKYSAMEHSQPDETPSYCYPIDEINDDINKFVNWLDSFKKKTSSAKS